MLSLLCGHCGAGASPGASTVPGKEDELGAALQASATGVHTPRDKSRKGQSCDINNPSHEKISGPRGHARRPRRKHVRKACEKAKERGGFTAGREVGSVPASTENEQASNGKKCTAAKSAPPAPLWVTQGMSQRQLASLLLERQSRLVQAEQMPCSK